MSSHLDVLAEERARLQRQIGSGRRELVVAGRKLQDPLQGLRRRAEHWRSMAMHLLLPVAVVVLLKPKAAFRALAALMGVWRLYQQLSGLLGSPRRRALPAPRHHP